MMPFLSDGDEGEVEMKDVWFSYPSRPNDDVLKVWFDAIFWIISESDVTHHLYACAYVCHLNIHYDSLLF
jgi:hypothetical protein